MRPLSCRLSKVWSWIATMLIWILKRKELLLSCVLLQNFNFCRQREAATTLLSHFASTSAPDHILQLLQSLQGRSQALSLSSS